MSLATRCTACGTVFRVVQDQLKVSEGWVRCGRCDAVFNAAEGLFDLEHEAPPPWSPTQPPAEVPIAAFEPAAMATGYHPPVRYEAETLASARDDVGVEADSPAALGAVASAPPAAAAVPADLISTALARHAGDTGSATASSSASIGNAREAPAERPTVADLGDAAAADGWRPDAERNRRSGRHHWAWLAAAVLLVCALAAQGAAQFSELAAARWPSVRPVLARWCGFTGCSVAAPRRIEDIVVDSSALAPVIGTDALKLGIALRNRADFAVALPSVDLSLTDSTGRLLARRTLGPADFRVAASSLAAGGELPLQAILTAGGAPVTGYTVEIFYP